MKTTFGDNLKKIRSEKGLTQEELGKKINVHPNHISRYERGETSPSAETLIAFADALEVTIDELVVGNRKKLLSDSINDIELLKLVKKLELLPDAEKQTVKSLLDAYIFRYETQTRLTVV